MRVSYDEPDFRFEYFGYESQLGRLETWGMRSEAQNLMPICRVENGELVQTHLRRPGMAR